MSTLPHSVTVNSSQDTEARPLLNVIDWAGGMGQWVQTRLPEFDPWDQSEIRELILEGSFHLHT